MNKKPYKLSIYSKKSRKIKSQIYHYKKLSVARYAKHWIAFVVFSRIVGNMSFI